MEKKAALFYTFPQNKSGGRMAEDDKKGIGEYVIIQASSPKEAYDRLEELGEGVEYFDYSCSCCGPRWEWPQDGTKYPKVWGGPPNEAGEPVFIHYLDGRIERIRPKPRKDIVAEHQRKEQEKKRKDLEKLTQKALSSLPRYIHDATWATYRKYFRDPSGRLMCFQFEKVYTLGDNNPIYRIALDARNSVNPDDLGDKLVITAEEYDKAKKELDAYLEGKDS